MERAGDSQGDARPALPAVKPVPVFTGSLDDGRHRPRQLALGVLGWLLVPALIVWLALHADEIAVRVTLFLLAIVVIIALVATAAAVDVLRPRLISARSHTPPELPPPAAVDALGRPVDDGRAPLMTGEFTIDAVDGERVYREEHAAR